MFIPVVVQSRHIHLSSSDQEKIFGSGEKLTPIGELGHKGQVVYKETVTLKGKNGMIERVRVYGPNRDQTQVEISATDAHALGVDVPIRMSGDQQNSAWITVQGSGGEIKTRSLMIPGRHLHCSDNEAVDLGLKNHEVVSVQPKGREDQIIEHVTIRVHPTFTLEFHLTSDEAQEEWLKTGDFVQVVSGEGPSDGSEAGPGPAGKI